MPLKMFTGLYRTPANFYWRNVFTYSISVVNEGIGFIISGTKINIIFISAMLLFTCSSLQKKRNILLPKHSISLLWICQRVMYCSCRNISPGDKGGQCVGLTNLPPSCVECLEIREPQPPGTLRACPGR